MNKNKSLIKINDRIVYNVFKFLKTALTHYPIRTLGKLTKSLV